MPRGRTGSKSPGRIKEISPKSSNGPEKKLCTHTNCVKVKKVKESLTELKISRNRARQRAGKAKTPTLLCIGCGYVEYQTCARPLEHFKRAKCCISASMIDGKGTFHCYKCGKDLNTKNCKLNARFETVVDLVQKYIPEDPQIEISGVEGKGGDGRKRIENSTGPVSSKSNEEKQSDAQKSNEQKNSGSESKEQASESQPPSGSKPPLDEKRSRRTVSKPPMVRVSTLPTKGLANLGNTCFFNSVMQNLAITDPLRTSLIRQGPTGTHLNDSLLGFMNEMSKSEGKRSSMNPSGVFSNVCRYHDRFRGGRQHDSHELLRALLDSLKEEKSTGPPITEKGKKVVDTIKKWEEADVKDWLKKLKLKHFDDTLKRIGDLKKTKINGEFMESLVLKPNRKKMVKLLKKIILPADREIFGKTIKKMRKGFMPGEEEKKKSDEKEDNSPSLVEQIFEGKVLNCVQCMKCKNVSVTPERFMDLSLAIAPPGGGKGKKAFSYRTGRLTKAQRKALKKQQNRENKSRKLQKQSATEKKNPYEDIPGANIWKTQKKGNKRLTKRQRREQWEQARRQKQLEKKLKKEAEEDAKRKEQEEKVKHESDEKDTKEEAKNEVKEENDTQTTNTKEDTKEEAKNEVKEENDTQTTNTKEVKEDVKEEKKDSEKQNTTEEEKREEGKSIGPPKEEAKEDIWMVVYKDGLNIRVEPKEDAEISGSLEFGEEVKALDTKNAWIKHEKGWTSSSNAVGTLYMARLEEAKALLEKKKEEKDESDGEEEDEDEEEETEVCKSEDKDTKDKYEFYREAFFPERDGKLLEGISEYTEASQKLLGNSSPRLEDCLKVYTAPETLPDESYICLNCTKAEGKGDLVRTKARKRVLIQDAPEIVTIHLKRFAATTKGFQKLGKQVKVPVTLDLAPFSVQGSGGKISEQFYGLYGIVVHSGSMGGGHYVAYTRRGSDKWFYFSDRTCQESREATVLKQQAYLCFYRRLPS